MANNHTSLSKIVIISKCNHYHNQTYEMPLLWQPALALMYTAALCVVCGVTSADSTIWLLWAVTINVKHCLSESVMKLILLWLLITESQEMTEERTIEDQRREGERAGYKKTGWEEKLMKLLMTPWLQHYVITLNFTSTCNIKPFPI